MAPGEVESLWFQAGMVGVFMAFTLVIFSYFLKFVKERNTEHAAERGERDEAWRIFLSEQNVTFVGFLKNEKEQRKEGMSHGMTEIEQVTLGLKELAAALGSHDTNAQTRHQAVMEALQRIERVENIRE